MVGSQYCGGSGYGLGVVGEGWFSVLLLLYEEFYPLPRRHSSGWPSRAFSRMEEGSPVWFVGREMARLCEQQG